MRPEAARPSSAPIEGPLIVVIADGWTKSVFDELSQAGDLPQIHEQLIGHGGKLSNVVTNVPSISIASHASVLTGSFPDQHQIAAHRWKYSDSGECHDYLSIFGPKNVERDLSPDVRTLHEMHPHLAGIAVQSIVSRGADRVSRLATMRSGPILQRAAQLIAETPSSTASIWLPRADAMGHRHGPEAEQVRQEMRATDRALGAFVTALTSSDATEQARIVLVPDHGQRLVKRHVDLAAVLGDRRHEVRVNPKHRASSAEVLVLTSGDSAANVYVQPGRSLRALAERAVKSSDDVALACIHDEDQHRFFGSAGESRAIQGGGGLWHYELIEGNDPLEILPNGVRDQALELSRVDHRGPYPDFLHQYLRSHVCGRSAELLLLAAPEVDFGSGPRIGYRLGFHQGTHGGPFASEVVVSAAYRGPVVEDVPVRTADLLGRLGMSPVAEDGTVARPLARR